MQSLSLNCQSPSPNISHKKDITNLVKAPSHILDEGLSPSSIRPMEYMCVGKERKGKRVPVILNRKKPFQVVYLEEEYKYLTFLWILDRCFGCLAYLAFSMPHHHGVGGATALPYKAGQAI